MTDQTPQSELRAIAAIAARLPDAVRARVLAAQQAAYAHQDQMLEMYERFPDADGLVAAGERARDALEVVGAALALDPQPAADLGGFHIAHAFCRVFRELEARDRGHVADASMHLICGALDRQLRDAALWLHSELGASLLEELAQLND